MLFDERARFPGKHVRHIFIFPKRGFSAGHIADPAYAVDDRLVMAITRMHLELLGIRLAGWPVADRRIVTNCDRIALFNTYDTGGFQCRQSERGRRSQP